MVFDQAIWTVHDIVVHCQIWTCDPPQWPWHAFERRWTVGREGHLLMMCRRRTVFAPLPIPEADLHHHLVDRFHHHFPLANLEAAAGSEAAGNAHPPADIAKQPERVRVIADGEIAVLRTPPSSHSTSRPSAVGGWS